MRRSGLPAVSSCPTWPATSPSKAEILSVGDGHLLADGTRVRHQVSEGDRIFFGRYAGTEVQVGDDELLIMSEDDILAVVT